MITKIFTFVLISLCLCISAVNISAQTETPPAPAAPKTVTIPAIQEKKLANGLMVAVVERKSSPIVTVQLLVKSGASSEDAGKAGLANLTAGMKPWFPKEVEPHPDTVKLVDNRWSEYFSLQ